MDELACECCAKKVGADVWWIEVIEHFAMNHRRIICEACWMQTMVWAVERGKQELEAVEG
jgi:hypothetical protein